MKIIITLAKWALSVIYAFFKLFPQKPHKILFLSRQSDRLSLDFSLLKTELEKQNSKAKIHAICNRMDDSKKGLLRFGFNTLASMYHLATAKVCVLDAYWPVVSMLRHKKGLTVIQMWHALGKIKQSGYQTLDKESGRSKELSHLLCMHKNYDYIIAGGKAWNPYYVASFGTTEDKLVNIGLPRIDYLLNTENENRQKIQTAYPQFKDKTVILYAPTFRRGYEAGWQELLSAVDFETCVLVVKGHPNQPLTSDHDKVLTCPEFSAVELLSACDYLITDYSAIAVEGAILNKKTYYYLYDYEQYTTKNGLNVDPFVSMPDCAFRDAHALTARLNSGNYPQENLDAYREKYLPEPLGTSTARLAELILHHCK